ncbi:MAG TPA: carboxypeptidase regulatory-like domain-containing protein [Vicinamibacterales bacterium]|jgi:plastocyanin|nr:carboxypeptidase regulatory-like domain-containing protein [Vicinamibacterales bacterium]
MSGSVWLRSGVVILCASASLAGFSPGSIAALHGIARAGGRGTVNAVVWLDAPNAPASLSSGKVVLDQRNLSFFPHVLAVRTGTVVDFPNNDRVFHNVFSFRDGKPFDLGIYPVGVLRHVKFDQTGLSRIFCNIHPGMSAYVMAVDTPYFAVSDDEGAFTINSVPPGTYTYHAWRAGGTAQGGSITVGAAAEAPLTIDWP